MQSTNSNTSPFAVTLLLFILGGGLLLYAYALVTVDDTFITLRYARNLAQGLGPVFNPGERVEGFSNPLWVLILAGLNWIPVDAIIISKLASAFCYMLCGAFLLIQVRRENKNIFLAALFYLASLSLVIWGVSGMETSLYSLLLLLWALTLADAEPVHLRVIVFATLLLMTRPEAPMPVMIGFGLLLIRKKPFLFSASIVFAISLTLLSLRFFYYHDFLPNTYYAKHFQTIHRWPITLFGYVRRYYFSIGLIPLLGLTAYLWKDRSKTALGLIAFALWPALFSVLVGGDWMPVFRFLIPTLPICIWLGMRTYSLWVNEYQRLTQILAAVSLGVYLVFNIQAAKEVEPMNFSFPTMEKIQLHASYNPAYFYMTNYLKTLTPPPQNMAVGELGYFGYYLNLPCLDLHGLIDTTIAKSKEFPNSVIGKVLTLSDAHFVNTKLGRYFLEKLPDLLVVNVGEVDTTNETIFNGAYHHLYTVGNITAFASKNYWPKKESGITLSSN